MPARKDQPKGKRPRTPSAAVPAPLTDVLALFTDIRGFTAWAESTDVFARLNEFVSGFMGVIHEHFPSPPHVVKPLGDGAMIVREIDPGTDASAAKELLVDTLKTIVQVNAGFDVLCRRFSANAGQGTNLRLGWGITRGTARRLNSDFVGSNINKCARLCDAARPFGIVIDREDFPEVPATEPGPFFEETRRAHGLDEVSVWVTQEIKDQFVAREKLRQTPEVHVAAVVIDASDRHGLRVLVVRRGLRRKLFPGKLAGPGGQLARSETFVEGVSRHCRTEIGIEVRVLQDVHCLYEIRMPEVHVIPGIRFLSEFVGGQVKLSPNYEWIKWYTEEEFRDTPADQFIAGVKEESIRLIDEYKRRRGTDEARPQQGM